MSAGSTSAVCHMRPGRAMGRVIAITHPDRPTMQFGHALDLAVIIDRLKGMLADAFKACLTTDGRLCTRDVAHFVMFRMGQLQAPTPGADALVAQIDDATKVTAFARLLTEAIETRQQPNGTIDPADVAAHVFSAMRSHRK